MKNTKHTPTPWKAQTYIENDNKLWHEIDGGNFCIAELQYPFGNRDQCDEQKANAEFIVRAVNSHESLLDVVRTHLFFDGNNMPPEQAKNLEGSLTVLEKRK